MAEDDQDLIEICEHLEEVEILSEVSDKYYDSAVKSSKKQQQRQQTVVLVLERMKSAAKKVGRQVSLVLLRQVLLLSLVG